MDPLTLLTIASSLAGGVKGARSARQSGQSPFSGFVTGALGQASGGNRSPFASMFGGSELGNGGAGVQLPRTDFSRFELPLSSFL